MKPIAARRLLLSDSIYNIPENNAIRIEENFYTYIELSNGTYKTTKRNRFTDLDNATTGYFNSLSIKPKHFLDVATSSGVSTDEWYEVLSDSGFEGITMTATDLALYAFVINIAGYIVVLVQEDGYPLQYDVSGFVVKAGKYNRKDYLNGQYLMGKILSLIYHRFEKNCNLRSFLASKGEANILDQEISFSGAGIRKVKLLSRFLKNETNITFVKDDLGLDNAPSMIKRFDVIRVANLLNTNYFSMSTISEWLARLVQRLKGADSYLILCRTEESGANNSTLFRLNDKGRLEVVLRSGLGSEIESLALSLCCEFMDV